MALAESDAPETVRFGAGGDSMRSHPSRGSSPNGGIEEGRGKVARRGGAIWVTPCRVRGCPRAVPRSGMRLARALPGRGHCWGPGGEGNGVGGMQNKLLAGLSVQRVVAGGRPHTQSVCLGWVWGCPLESSVSRASLPLQSLLPPSWRLHFGGCIFTKGQLLQSA